MHHGNFIVLIKSILCNKLISSFNKMIFGTVVEYNMKQLRASLASALGKWISLYGMN